MSAEGAAGFAERLATDEAFAQQLAGAATPEERQQIARQAGYDVDENDVGAIRSALGVEELSDQDLEAVAGGVDTETVVSTVIISAMGVGAVSVAAAAV